MLTWVVDRAEFYLLDEVNGSEATYLLQQFRRGKPPFPLVFPWFLCAR